MALPVFGRTYFVDITARSQIARFLRKHTQDVSHSHCFERCLSSERTN